MYDECTGRYLRSHGSQPKSASQAQPGDWLFWGSVGGEYHAGMYIGNGSNDRRTTTWYDNCVHRLGTTIGLLHNLITMINTIRFDGSCFVASRDGKENAGQNLNFSVLYYLIQFVLSLAWGR